MEGVTVKMGVQYAFFFSIFAEFVVVMDVGKFVSMKMSMIKKHEILYTQNF